jgi:hypothetical protein
VAETLGLGEANVEAEVLGAADGLAEWVAAEDVPPLTLEVDGAGGTVTVPADGVFGCAAGAACGAENGVSVLGETGPPSRPQTTISE